MYKMLPDKQLKWETTEINQEPELSENTDDIQGSVRRKNKSANTRGAAWKARK